MKKSEFVKGYVELLARAGADPKDAELDAVIEANHYEGKRGITWDPEEPEVEVLWESGDYRFVAPKNWMFRDEYGKWCDALTVGMHPIFGELARRILAEREPAADRLAYLLEISIREGKLDPDALVQENRDYLREICASLTRDRENSPEPAPLNDAGLCHVTCKERIEQLEKKRDDYRRDRDRQFNQVVKLRIEAEDLKNEIDGLRRTILDLNSSIVKIQGISEKRISKIWQISEIINS